MDFFFPHRWIPLLATLGAAALAVFVGITNLEDVRSIQKQANHLDTSSGNGSGATPVPADRINLAEIANWHLFGAEKPPETAAPVKPALTRTEAPKTRLKLTLQGIFSPMIEGQEGWAIIEAPQEDPRAYRIGDEVPGGAILTAVESDQVILTRNDRPESLPLEQDALDVAFSAPELDLPGEMEEIAPEPVPQPVPRPRARARIPKPPIDEPVDASLPEPYIDPEPAMEPQVYEPPAYEQTEPVEPPPTPAPAIEAADQNLHDEMRRLRESFEQQR